MTGLSDSDYRHLLNELEKNYLLALRNAPEHSH